MHAPPAQEPPLDCLCGKVVLGAELVKADRAVHSNAPGEQDHAGQHLDIQLHCEEGRVLHRATRDCPQHVSNCRLHSTRLSSSSNGACTP